MTTATKRHPVSGSERAPLAGARIVGPADPNERILVSVLVRRKPTSKGFAAMMEKMEASPPSEREYLSREKFAAAHGASPADLEKIEEFAHEHGLDVVEANAAQRRVLLSGTVANLSNAFGVYLARYKHPGGSYRGREGNVHVPEDLAPIIE